MNQIRVGFMQTARLYIEKLLFPGFASSVRRRNMRFLLLAVVLGVFASVAFGAILYLLNSQGRIT
jgi:hypothetical protein